MTLSATEQPIDTKTSAGKCFLDMLGVFGEFETNLRKERQMEGIAKAKERGVYKGRKPSVDVGRVKELRDSGMGAFSDCEGDGNRYERSVYRALTGYEILLLTTIRPLFSFCGFIQTLTEFPQRGGCPCCGFWKEIPGITPTDGCIVKDDLTHWFYVETIITQEPYDEHNLEPTWLYILDYKSTIYRVLSNRSEGSTQCGKPLGFSYSGKSDCPLRRVG